MTLGGPRVVDRDGNTISFGPRVNDQALRDFVALANEAITRRGYQDLVFDFTNSERAYPQSMLPIFALADAYRADGVGIDLRLPSAQEMSRLFINCGWAHFIDPEHFPADAIQHDRHLATSQYVEFPDQQKIVDASVDVIMHNMELDREVLASLEWSLNEITDNVLNHAESDRGGFVQVSTFTGSPADQLRRCRCRAGDSGVNAGGVSSVASGLGRDQQGHGARSDAQRVGGSGQWSRRHASHRSWVRWVIQGEVRPRRIGLLQASRCQRVSRGVQEPPAPTQLSRNGRCRGAWDG